jgi:hypothetical protein
LDDSAIEDLAAKYGRVASVAWSGHTLVFRRPTREHVRDYRRKLATPAEQADAMDQMAQALIVAYDDTNDPNGARVKFTGEFLVEYPMAVGHPHFAGALLKLAGGVQEEEELDLGKGVRFWRAAQKPSPTASPNGSPASSTNAS